MSQKIYNTQTKQKEDFQTLEPGKVKMYVCGPTVYDFLHIGNYRGAIFFNLVRNWLEKNGFDVTYVYNYTDVDDKIINAANEQGLEPNEITERFIGEFQKDYEDLKLRPHSHNPRVTEHMDDIVNFVESLVSQNKAYVKNGDVYYDVKSFESYGKLSNKNIDDMEAGFRIDVDAGKKHPADFALWKSSKAGEPAWDSPWGPGRPGWHIECSAMIRAILGDTIDIHGGGLDLVFPHHENEIAQSEGCTGKHFVKYWMHNNMLTFGDKKMSKSLGNVRTGRSFLEEYNGEILKYLMLSAHYRNQLDFTDQAIERTISSLAKFYSSLSLAKDLTEKGAPLAGIPDTVQKTFDEADSKITEALNDDFNTPEVLAALFELTRVFNNHCRKPGKVKPEMVAIAEAYYHFMRSKGEVMALFNESPAEFLKILDDMLLSQKGLSRDEVDALVSRRAEARANKDWSKSDELRDQLTEMGISVMDTAEGSSWEVSK